MIILRSPISSHVRAFFTGFNRIRFYNYSIFTHYKLPHYRVYKRKSRRV